ncbi:inositol phospholipid synthesis and fat-storage-inducing TM-domain-containing protein [Cristinia sonorae]|uniref:Inositol phospholipid synthesis and fat-storage-inducing TM-domain-containing protein n=1 Tax=Cristinia sonorae TaxID=1940300 RepID=A0A8K0V0J2_9AGAR|nr:inositol phospholipid synthesis and fat-storage-inducing TM-domain-containing protein [Cristinia sonorae]
MPRLTTTSLAVVTAVVLYGTAYSVLNETYLDTSNPILTHLPHPLHNTTYFASKKNILNVYFIKRLWGWVSLSFLALYFTSPPATRTRKRIFQFLMETAVWLVFTSWFFGAPVLERVIANTGGACVVSLPSGAIVTVPNDLCYSRTPVSPATHPSLFAASVAIPDVTYRAQPRLRKGHDVSGHIFLLTMSTLFLVDQLKYSFRRVSHSTAGGRTSQVLWPQFHGWTVLLNALVIAASLFAMYTTSVYFHTPFEKFTGYLLGVAGFALTQLPMFNGFTPSRS